jgi:hypothetical protein
LFIESFLCFEYIKETYSFRGIGGAFRPPVTN